LTRRTEPPEDIRPTILHHWRRIDEKTGALSLRFAIGNWSRLQGGRKIMNPIAEELNQHID